MEEADNEIDEVSVTSTDAEDDQEGHLEIPDTVLLKIFQFLYLEHIKDCRSVCKLWNVLTMTPTILPGISCFIYDGRRDGSNSTNCEDFLRESPLGISIWTQMRIRRANFKQISWISQELTSTINVLELNNCSLSWYNILFVMSECENLKSFSDIQDMYCWDYSTFAEGLDNDEQLDENDSFKALNQDKLANLQNLRNIRVHRSQFADCTIYLKMLNLRCDKLETVSVTTDQSLNPRPSLRFYESLGDLIRQNSSTLQTLWFPYRHIYPVYEFRITDDTHPMRDFLTFVTENHWADVIKPEVLSEISFQFPVIHVDEIFFKQKLLPFLEAWTSLKKLYLNCILLEAGKENILIESIPKRISPYIGVWVSDNSANGSIPFLEDLREHFHTLTVQTWRPNWTQLTDILALPDLESGDRNYYQKTAELQYFNKSPGFTSFNVNQIIQCFSGLTHLNLVDHNTRGERLHSSEALATIEDEDMQLIVTHLRKLTFLQINGNMTFLTDSGITGISPTACKRMVRLSLVKRAGDMVGQSFSNMKNLRHVVLRGVGIKITDVTAFFGFTDMPKLRKLHVYGAQQVTLAARTYLSQKFPTLKGCDIQI